MFELPEETQILKDMIRRFVENEVEPLSAKIKE